ncbi:MAG: DUF2188 domain-containing protein [Actinobacteria bacterium]|nr:DUF2188 domain-containing protein [Actinomycetota bacterium]
MSGKNQHVVPVGGKWGVRGEGNTKLTSIFDKKTDALKVGRDIAINQQSELIIHGKDGRIQDKDSFGNDPTSSKDKIH